MTTLRLICSTLTLVVLSSCVPKAAQFGPKGVTSEDFGYHVAYVEGSQQEAMPPEWRLDNFVKSKRGELKPKSGQDYIAKFLIDRDGDGRSETTLDRSRYDLRYVNRTNSGVVFLRHIPIGSDMQNVEPRVLLRNYVNGIAGASYDTVEFGGEHHLINKERRYATRIISQGEGTWAGVRAFRAEVEIANLDQLKLDPNAREALVTLVLAHAPYALELRSGGHDGKKTQKVHVVIMAGYANSPADFEAGSPAFEDFLQRLSFESVSGATAFQLQGPTSAPAATAAPPDAPAPTTASPAPAATQQPASTSTQP